MSKNKTDLEVRLLIEHISIITGSIQDVLVNDIGSKYLTEHKTDLISEVKYLENCLIGAYSIKNSNKDLFDFNNSQKIIDFSTSIIKTFYERIES